MFGEDEMQQLFGLVLGFFLLPVLLLRKVRMSIALFATGSAMGLIAGINPMQMLGAATRVFTVFSTFNSVLTVAGVGILGLMFRRYSLLELIVENIGKLVHSVKVTAMLLPALMGLLPVPGGAMLSAPMADAIGERLSLSPERRVSVNLAFRHTVFMMIPYCATNVLIISMSPPFSVGLYLTVGFCFMCVTFASGYFLFLRQAPNVINEFEKKDRMPALRGLIAGLTPVILVILLNNAAGLTSSLSVALSIIITGMLHRREGFVRHVKDGFAFETVLMMCGIYFIRNIIAEMDSLIAMFIDLLMNSGGLAVVFLLCGICFFMGFATGMNLVPMSIVLPIVMVLPMNGSHIMMLTFIVMLWSFFGYYLSPLHLCHLLSMKSIPCRRMESTRENLWHMLILMAASFVFYFGIIFIWL